MFFHGDEMTNKKHWEDVYTRKSAQDFNYFHFRRKA